MNKKTPDGLSDEAADEATVNKLIGEIGQIRSRTTDAIRELAAAREDYYTAGQLNLRTRMDALEEKARALNAGWGERIHQLQTLCGIPDELIEAIEEELSKSDDDDRIYRSQLTQNEVPPTDSCEDFIVPALESIYHVVDKKWLETEKSKPYRFGNDFLKSPYSLVRGARIQSENPVPHRFAQAIFVCEDFLSRHAEYDFMAGALLVPQTIQLGLDLETLKSIKGAGDRIRSLWRLPSEQADSTTYELLVAAASAERGRDLEFLPETSVACPDLRVNDYPFPTFIECKRKRPFSDFEFEEEKHTRAIFEALRAAASKIGLWGTFSLTLFVDPEVAPSQEIVDCALRQRFSFAPDVVTEYSWGSISYCELPNKISFPRTRLYSPLFLQHLFHWNTDLPDHDGIICKVKTPEEIWVDTAEEPVALLWKVTTTRATTKRSWTVKSLYKEAMRQVPPGGAGIFYICHQEGTREQISDLRLNEFVCSMASMHHSAAIRLPIFFLTRLYPRALNHGSPDLIENGVRFLSSYADPIYFRDFPTTVFTHRSPDKAD